MRPEPRAVHDARRARARRSAPRTGPRRSRSTTSVATRTRRSRRSTARSSGRSRTSAASTSSTPTFPEAGRYGAEFTTAAAGGAPTTVRLTFDVQPSSEVVKVGDKAPASKTPTLADVGGDPTHISTDAEPDPAFYQTSVDDGARRPQAVRADLRDAQVLHQRAVRPNARSDQAVRREIPGVTFINVEPYKLKLVDGILAGRVDANGHLIPRPLTDEWHLFNEPTVFVVDRDGHRRRRVRPDLLRRRADGRPRRRQVAARVAASAISTASGSAPSGSA